jgi:hypothetical protein
MNVKKRIKKYGFVTICSDCGMPIKKEQLGLRIADAYTPDYSERAEAVVTINFCNDCWERIKANNKGGMEKAIRKFEESQEVEDSMKEAYERRNRE